MCISFPSQYPKSMSIHSSSSNTCTYFHSLLQTEPISPSESGIVQAVLTGPLTNTCNSCGTQGIEIEAKCDSHFINSVSNVMRRRAYAHMPDHAADGRIVALRQQYVMVGTSRHLLASLTIEKLYPKNSHIVYIQPNVEICP